MPTFSDSLAGPRRFTIRPGPDGAWEIVDTSPPSNIIVMASSPSEDVANAIAAFMNGNVGSAAVLWETALARHDMTLID